MTKPKGRKFKEIITCGVCEGTGTVYDRDKNTNHMVPRNCPACHGQGHWEN